MVQAELSREPSRGNTKRSPKSLPNLDKRDLYRTYKVDPSSHSPLLLRSYSHKKLDLGYYGRTDKKQECHPTPHFSQTIISLAVDLQRWRPPPAHLLLAHQALELPVALMHSPTPLRALRAKYHAAHNAIANERATRARVALTPNRHPPLLQRLKSA